jgi:hypothetical protein
MTVASLKDPATAVDTARRLMLAGTWKTVPKTGDDADKAVYTLRVHTPATLTVLPRVAAEALTRRLLNGRGSVDPVGGADPVVRAGGCRRANSPAWALPATHPMPSWTRRSGVVT